MPDRARLQAELRRIDGRPYPAYRDLRGRWRLGELELLIDHVQGDPFAAPSRLRLRAPSDLPHDLLADEDGRLAAEDWLLRRFGCQLQGSRRGSGRSGELRVYQPGPEVLQRSALLLLRDGRAEVRLSAGLPARGRRILGRQAAALLLEDLPRTAQRLRPGPARPELDRHVESVRTQRALRRQLRPRGLVAFVADGAILPRASGVDSRPLADAVPFTGPESLRLRLDTPQGPLQGMGLPEGVTVIAGGGFHGKSTLLQALQRGHLDHVPGDGRERVVSDPDCVKIRAEDGRSVASVDISAFLRELPGGRGTAPFDSEDASGSTSQAAAIVEALEAGARLLLMDEDTSATNLLVRDERMRRLIPRDKEPITPLVERVRQLHRHWGVSSVLVVGGVGDYLAAADLVIGMDSWLPQDLTARARVLAGAAPAPPGPLPERGQRLLARASLVPSGKGRVRARNARRMEYGREEVDLVAVEQVLDGAHAATLGQALRVLEQIMDGPRLAVPAALDQLEALIESEGLDTLSPFREPVGALVRPRRHEVAAALNRLRGLRVMYRA